MKLLSAVILLLLVGVTGVCFQSAKSGDPGKPAGTPGVTAVTPPVFNKNAPSKSASKGSYRYESEPPRSVGRFPVTTSAVRSLDLAELRQAAHERFKAWEAARAKFDEAFQSAASNTTEKPKFCASAEGELRSVVGALSAWLSAKERYYSQSKKDADRALATTDSMLKSQIVLNGDRNKELESTKQELRAIKNHRERVVAAKAGMSNPENIQAVDQALAELDQAIRLKEEHIPRLEKVAELDMPLALMKTREQFHDLSARIENSLTLLTLERKNWTDYYSVRGTQVSEMCAAFR